VFLGDLEGHGTCVAVMNMPTLCPGSVLYLSVSYYIRLGVLRAGNLHCVGVHFSSNNVFDSPVVATVTIEASDSSSASW
jgi:hypothetical protein